MAEPSRAGQEAPGQTGELPIEASDHRDLRLEVHDLPDGGASRHARRVVREVLRKVGVEGGHADDAELAVGELVANSISYADGPYELRFVIDGDRPVWCEVIDSDDDLVGIPEILEKLRFSEASECAVGEVPQEHGHGLVIVHRLSSGRCKVYPTLVTATGRPGKAVAFALPENPSP